MIMRRRDRSDDWVTVWSTEEEKNEHGICFWGLQWPLAGYRRGPSSLSLIESGVRVELHGNEEARDAQKGPLRPDGRCGRHH